MLEWISLSLTEMDSNWRLVKLNCFNIETLLGFGIYGVVVIVLQDVGSVYRFLYCVNFEGHGGYYKSRSMLWNHNRFVLSLIIFIQRFVIIVCFPGPMK